MPRLWIRGRAVCPPSPAEAELQRWVPTNPKLVRWRNLQAPATKHPLQMRASSSFSIPIPTPTNGFKLSRLARCEWYLED